MTKKKYLYDFNKTPIIVGMHAMLPVGKGKSNMKLVNGIVDGYTRTGYIRLQGYGVDDAGLLVKTEDMYYRKPEAIFVHGVPTEVQEEYIKVMEDNKYD